MIVAVLEKALSAVAETLMGLSSNNVTEKGGETSGEDMPPLPPLNSEFAPRFGRGSGKRKEEDEDESDTRGVVMTWDGEYVKITSPGIGIVLILIHIRDLLEEHFRNIREIRKEIERGLRKQGGSPPPPIPPELIKRFLSAIESFGNEIDRFDAEADRFFEAIEKANGMTTKMYARKAIIKTLLTSMRTRIQVMYDTAQKLYDINAIWWLYDNKLFDDMVSSLRRDVSDLELNLYILMSVFRGLEIT